MRLIIGVLIVLHGLVHLLYFGQSARYFELQPGMLWPDGSWVFSKLLGDEQTRRAAAMLLVVVAIGFVVGGIAIILGQVWGRRLNMALSIFSSLIFLLFWDGAWQQLDNKGAIGLLINAAIVIVSLIV